MPACLVTSRRLRLAKPRSASSSNAASRRACRVRSLRSWRLTGSAVTRASVRTSPVSATSHHLQLTVRGLCLPLFSVQLFTDIGGGMTALVPGRIRRLASLAEALLTPHGMDRYLELINPMLVRNEIRGVVTAVRRQTADTVTLTIRPSRAWRGFTAGQYVRVSVDIDGVRRTRCYSPAGSQHQHDGQLELTIKADPKGLVSRHLHKNAQRGMVLGLSQPDGGFTLPE